MAKSKQNPWIPSGGVLIAAIVAAVVAAILLNIYLSMVEAPYKEKMYFYRLKNDVPKGQKVEKTDVEPVAIPRPLAESDLFRRFARVDEVNPAWVGQPARYKLIKGNLLALQDVYESPDTIEFSDLPEGYQVVTIQIEPEPSLQPGMYVTLRASVDRSPENKNLQNIDTIDVMSNVKVRAIGGYRQVDRDRRQRTDNIQIYVQQENAKRLLQLEHLLYDKKYRVAIEPIPKGRTEPTMSPEVLDLLQKRALAGSVAP